MGGLKSPGPRPAVEIPLDRIVDDRISGYNFKLGLGYPRRIAVKTIRFSKIVIALLAFLLTSPTFATEFCGGAKLMCAVQTADSDIGAAKKMSVRRDKCGCTGSGAQFFACHCKCLGEPGFPCRPDKGPHGERRCICQ
jgi:hypothetical protein